MSQAASRWEFRIWRDVSSVLQAGRTEERTDIYLLRPGIHARLVKLREGSFDVKDLHEAEDGLELWHPRRKHGFPIPSGDVAAALCLPPVTRARLNRRFDSASGLLAGLDRVRDIAAVPLHKRRIKWTEKGCPGETVQVLFRDAWYESVALEHEDPERVARARNVLGWQGELNMNYGAWLSRILAQDQPAIALTSA